MSRKVMVQEAVKYASTIASSTGGLTATQALGARIALPSASVPASSIPASAPVIGPLPGGATLDSAVRATERALAALARANRSCGAGLLRPNGAGMILLRSVPSR